MTHRVVILAALALAPLTLPAQQVADTTFDMSVARPAHTARHPRLGIDEAHNNFHTATGRYAPFAALMRNDGLQVTASANVFTAQVLAGFDVLVISNPVAPGMAAAGATAATATSAPAFTNAECDAVRDWVRNGGSLLLIADHAPFGSAAEILAKRFGVDFHKGFVTDAEHFLPGRGPSMLVFKNELLGAHAIMNGRDTTERIRNVVSFTGQSMSIPKDATPLLKLSPTARESANREDLAAGKSVPAAGFAQGIAMTFGKGRVVMLGEAAMMSAQLAAGAQAALAAPFTMGMNLPGTDDKQFALNVVRWLTRALD
jgi:hypothetical protein